MALHREAGVPDNRRLSVEVERAALCVPAPNCSSILRMAVAEAAGDLESARISSS